MTIVTPIIKPVEPAPLSRDDVIALRDRLIASLGDSLGVIATRAHIGLEYIELDNLAHVAHAADSVIAHAEFLKGVVAELRKLKWRATEFLKQDAATERLAA
jgi:hypothetical protein